MMNIFRNLGLLKEFHLLNCRGEKQACHTLGGLFLKSNLTIIAVLLILITLRKKNLIKFHFQNCGFSPKKKTFGQIVLGFLKLSNIHLENTNCSAFKK